MKIFVHVLTAATATCRCATTARLSTSSCSLTSCLAFALNSNSPCFLIRDRSLLADSCLRFLGSYIERLELLRIKMRSGFVDFLEVGEVLCYI